MQAQPLCAREAGPVIVVRFTQPGLGHQHISCGRFERLQGGGLRVQRGQQADVTQQALADGATFSDTVQACMSNISELKPQLRALLHYHCGVKVLKTRQLMIDLQAL